MILITCNVRDSSSDDDVIRLIDSIKYNKEVLFYYLDLRQDKKDFSYQKDGVRIEYLKVSLEDQYKTFDIAYNIALQSNVAFYCNLESNIKFTTSLDEFLTDDLLNNNNISICHPVYFNRNDGVFNSYEYFHVNSNGCTFFRNYPQNMLNEAIKNKMNYVEFLAKAFVVKLIHEPVYTLYE